jgi:hypothetical protein
MVLLEGIELSTSPSDRLKPAENLGVEGFADAP